MIENITLIFFIIILISSIVLKLPLALALFFNLILLIIYCLISGKKLKDIFDFLDSLRTLTRVEQIYL